MKQETEEDDFSPTAVAMIATLDDSEESRELVEQLRAARCLAASVSCFREVGSHFCACMFELALFSWHGSCMLM